MNFPLCLRSSLLLLGSLCVTGHAWGSDVGHSGNTAALRPISSEQVTVPGPLRSFLRMSGVSQKVQPEDVLPLLAREVFALGFERGRQTEFLSLLQRYVRQAREMAALAGPDGKVHITNCEDAKPLLRVLGYRTRQDCGHRGTSLLTADADRAFLTIDSGFPLVELEETLQGGSPFVHDMQGTKLPVIFTEKDWAATDPSHDKSDLIDVLLHSQEVAVLYWALSRMDAETAATLQQHPGLTKLLPYGSLLNFYGAHISIRGGHVLVPGGVKAEPVWKELVGADPAASGEFVSSLLSKDKGWLLAYFDALSRTAQAQQAHFAEGTRLKRCYEAFRVAESSGDASKRAFRPAPGLLLLLTRLQWDANGEVIVPGGIDTWKDIFRQKNAAGLVKKWSKGGKRLSNNEQLLEAMFSFARVETDGGPLQAYLFLNELDSQRPANQRLAPATVRALAAKYAQYSDQYLIFSEFPELSDASITHFLGVVESLDKVQNMVLRGNAMGIFQANVGLWQILARQGQIPADKLNESWEQVITPFAKIQSATDAFDAGVGSLSDLLRTASGRPSSTQDDIISMMAGPAQSSPDGQRMHQELAKRVRLVLDGQRLVSLDTLIALGDGLKEMAKGAPAREGLLGLAGELREFEMPRPIFTKSERTEWATGIYNNRHTDLEMKTDLAPIIKSATHTKGQMDEARGQLAPFLRDVLVGLNYAYYEPPGAQIMHHNPLFVRSHDFAGETVVGVEHVWQAPQMFGEGAPAGGGAHLIGSLADLPYVLARVEQDFIAPENVQALIWRELVPGLLTNSILPRWWTVSQNEVHAVALYQRAGEELLAASSDNEELRGKVLAILADRMSPQKLGLVEQAVRAKQQADILPQMTPADTFYLTAEFRLRFPSDKDSWGKAGHELDDLQRQFPTELEWERLSQHFGVPHPMLAQSYARQLLNVRPFPAMSGFSSRLLAESWDSSNLYWARLADEMGYSPVTMNRIVPQLTHRMVEKIFASDLEDWPAVLRAMRETGDEVRDGKMASLAINDGASRP